MSMEVVPALAMSGASFIRLMNQSLRLSVASQVAGKKEGVDAQVATLAQIVLATGHSMNRWSEVSKLR